MFSRVRRSFTRLPRAATAALVAVLCVLALVVAVVVAAVHDSPRERQERLIAELRQDPAVDSLVVDDSSDGLRAIRVLRDITVAQIRDLAGRLEGAGIDADFTMPDPRVNGATMDRWDAPVAAPAFVALSGATPGPTPIEIHVLNDRVSIDVRMGDDTRPADGAEVVLALLERFSEVGLPEEVELVSATTWHGALADVLVGGESLVDLDRTIAGLRRVIARDPSAGIECLEATCRALGA